MQRVAYELVRHTKLVTDVSEQCWSKVYRAYFTKNLERKHLGRNSTKACFLPILSGQK